ncbi:SGNH/GDSL hydrolase family protein [Halalkalibaculum sp. DA3122]|uniref:SGNH/GDSL hydrolase family protein n=1 Tax=Halalkalibaculum sp. DA3122 TaxID=3373607 RepID=UPI0037546F76
MKFINTLPLFFCCACFILAGCEGQESALVDARLEENPVPEQQVQATQGNADFTKYVAMGNSITAGLMDAALYNDGQKFNFANLLAEELKMAVENDGENFDPFDQPDINAENGFNISVPNPDPESNTVLGRFELDPDIPGPVPTPGEPIAPFTGDKEALNNFGVPGIVVGQLLTPATGGPQSPQNPAFTPFYQRFATDPGTSTILGDAINTQPTFFTLWIGSNDVLGYALSGASNEALLTGVSNFENQFNTVVNNLLAGTSASGVVINIPPILALPFFQAVSYNAITLDPVSANQLNEAFSGFNTALEAIVTSFGHDPEDADRRKVHYAAGNNPILVIDEELEDLGPKFDQLQMAGAINAQQRAALVPYEQARPLDPGELVLLQAGALLGTEADGDDSERDTPVGVVVPLGFDLSDGTLNGDPFYLTKAEQTRITERSVSFNTAIATAVASNSDRLALYDTNDPQGIFHDLFGLDGSAPGITIEGVTLQPDFSPNGVFSTDGVHPNPRGNAIIANEIIGVIEKNFGSEIPRVDVLNLGSVVLAR